MAGLWSPLGSDELPKTAKWHPEPLLRGTTSILTASLLTLSLCVWTALHLNIPLHGATWWTKLKRKLKWLAIGTVVPEYVLYVAAIQWLSAQTAHLRIIRSFAMNGLQEAHALSWGQRRWKTLLQAPRVSGRESDSQDKEASQDGMERDDVELGNVTATPRPRMHRRASPWTIRHTHYLQMGGFVFDPSCVFTDDNNTPFLDTSQPELGRRLCLTAEAVVFLSKHAPEMIPDISEADLAEKSNANSLSRVLAIMQAIWFLVQFILRLSVGLPVSILELNVVGHIVFAVFVFLFWWRKPLDIDMPTQIPAKSPEGCSLLAAMYIRSQIGYMQRVDGYHFWKNPHTAYLDLAPGTPETPHWQESETEAASGTDATSDSGDQSAEILTPAVVQDFQNLHSQERHGIHVVALSHHRAPTINQIDKLRSPTPLLGDYIMIGGHSETCPCSETPSFHRKVRFTVSNARRRVFELAQKCEHLPALGVTSTHGHSAIRSYLERVCCTEPSVWPAQARLRQDFVIEPPSEQDVGDLNDGAVAFFNLLFFVFSSIFGVLHMLAWNGPFSTHAELVLWRIAAITLALPLVVMIAGVVAWLHPPSLIFGPMPIHHLHVTISVLARFAHGFGLTSDNWQIWYSGMPPSVLTRASILSADFQRLASKIIRSSPKSHSAWLGYIITCFRYQDLTLLVLVSSVYLPLFVLSRLYFLSECIVNLLFAPPRVFELHRWTSWITW